MDESPVFKDYILFDINDAQYIGWPEAQMKEFPKVLQNRSLVTLIFVPARTTLDHVFVDAFISDAFRADDVICSNFLRGVFFYGAERHAISDEVQKSLKRFDNQWSLSICESDVDHPLLSGPYVLEGKSLWTVSRLYADTASAFTVGLRTLSNKRLEVLQLQGSGQTPAIAVPSRLRSRGSLPGGSLRGIRITVKDIFDIAGLKTGLGSRAYTELYGPAINTAPSIQKLLNAGAELVSMSKMCSMVLKASPTQCVDVSAPFNPRGDGYLSPSGGSSGQAAAVATYPWLDFAIGSDSTFSGRMPAQANGCFSLRPTLRALSTEGMWSGVSQFDTPCVFGRDINTFKNFISVWYGSALPHTVNEKLPLALLTPSDLYDTGSGPQRQIFADFVADLEKFLCVHAHRVSLSDLWNREPPVGAENKGLSEYLSEDIATGGYIYSFWKKISKFYSEYQAVFHKKPFMPPPKGIERWSRARRITAEQHQRALTSLSVYRSWLMETFLQTHKRDVLLVMPLGSVEPSYRDEWPQETNLDQQLREPLLIAPIVGGPELVVPAGQISYKSRISGREEPIPVCVSLMGLPGSDLKLLEIASRFLDSISRPTNVHVGRDMFHPASRS